MLRTCVNLSIYSTSCFIQNIHTTAIETVDINVCIGFRLFHWKKVREYAFHQMVCQKSQKQQVTEKAQDLELVLPTPKGLIAVAE